MKLVIIYNSKIKGEIISFKTRSHRIDETHGAPFFTNREM